jgi:hypothetical protein
LIGFQLINPGFIPRRRIPFLPIINSTRYLKKSIGKFRTGDSTRPENDRRPVNGNCARSCLSLRLLCEPRRSLERTSESISRNKSEARLRKGIKKIP